MTEPFAFVLAVIALLATPGPTNTLLLTSGATAGGRSLLLIPAEIAGYLTSILTIGYVVAPLTADFWQIKLALRLFAAGYLAIVAFRLWRRAPNLLVRDRLIRVRDVFVTTLLNPKALLFALGIVPLQDPSATWYLIVFCLLVGLIGASWIGIGMAIARGLLPEARRSLLPRAGAAVIAGFAGYLVLMPLT